MKLKEKSNVSVIDSFNSSAIKSLTFDQQSVSIVYKSSPKEYKYSVNDTNFEELVINCVKNSESVGKLVNKAIKENKIQIIDNIESKINNNVV